MPDLRAELATLAAEAAYVLARYRHDPKASVISIPYRARAQSVATCARLEARLAEEQARVDGATDVEPTSAELAERRGELRAERARLEARIAAEQRAMAQTRKIFNIRLATLKKTGEV